MNVYVLVYKHVYRIVIDYLFSIVHLHFDDAFCSFLKGVDAKTEIFLLFTRLQRLGLKYQML